jgi:hypothetical protein
LQRDQLGIRESHRDAKLLQLGRLNVLAHQRMDAALADKPSNKRQTSRDYDFVMIKTRLRNLHK